jgi:putative mRNA 3-end processing factor
LYCQRGDFVVDPWQPVNRAVVTHAHTDHLCRGCSHYLVARDGLSVTRARLDPNVSITAVAYGEPVVMNGVHLSLHPAGHILGSAQIRLEHAGQVWVVSGDYKIEPDPTCSPYAPLDCHVFISECTFGLPIYQWPQPVDVLVEILTWWQTNRQAGRASLLYAHSLGKAQRILAGLAKSIGSAGWPGPVYTHGAVEVMNQAYRAQGLELPLTIHAAEAGPATDWTTSLIIAPPSAMSTTWAHRFKPASTAFASGWMRIRGTRRHRSIDRGFVLSDHVDWPGLLTTIDVTNAETIYLTHGYSAIVARWLQEHGKNAQALITSIPGSDITETT